jgi:hypothetical protein
VSGGDAGRTPVRISVPTAPGKRLTARVIEPAKGGKADISADSDIRLENLRYTCGLPPKTICPAKDVEVKGSSAELAFSVTDESPPIVLTADVASAE